jgi:hypothetical protein
MTDPYAGPIQLTGYVPPGHYYWTVADCEGEQWQPTDSREEAEDMVGHVDDRFVHGERLTIWPPGWSPQFLHDQLWEDYGEPDEDTECIEEASDDELETMEDFL